MTGNEFHEKLDGFYAGGDVAGAYAFLRETRSAALAAGDRAMLLTADNALIGHCRENVLFDEVEGYYREACACIEVLGLHGSHAEATTFLNTATAYCIMGRAEESEALYRELLPPNDPYMAAIRNNRGLLLRARGKNEAAFALFRESLNILLRCEDVEAEKAATLLNLASVCTSASQAQTYMDCAMQYYETPEGQQDIHRFTAMATKAEIAFRSGNYAAAGDGYAAAADAWEHAALAPQRLRILLANAEMCYERAGDAPAAARMRERKEAIAP